MGYGLGSPGVSKLFEMYEQAISPTQHQIQWVPRVLCLGVKWLGSGVDRSPPSVDVKIEWGCTSYPCICPHGVHRDGFISPFNCSEKYIRQINTLHGEL